MKKVSNVIPEKSNKMYEEFISTRVLNDKDIILLKKISIII